MLRCHPFRNRHGFIQVLGYNDGRIPVQGLADDVPARGLGSLVNNRLPDRFRQGRIRRKKNAGGLGVMLTLAQQVRRQPGRIGIAIGHNEDFRGPGNHVNVHNAVQ